MMNQQQTPIAPAPMFTRLTSPRLRALPETPAPAAVRTLDARMAGASDVGRCPDVIARARLGDGAAFGELYETYSRQVHAFIQRRVKEPADAEDLTGDTFTRAFVNIARYRWEGKSILAWLYTIARNAIIDATRRARPTCEIEEAFMHPTNAITAQESAERGEELDALRAAIATLTASQQTVIGLRFVDDLSTKEVAARLGVNDGAVRAIQFRAVNRLRTLLGSPATPKTRKARTTAPVTLIAIARMLRAAA